MLTIHHVVQASRSHKTLDKDQVVCQIPQIQTTPRRVRRGFLKLALWMSSGSEHCKDVLEVIKSNCSDPAQLSGPGVARLLITMSVALVCADRLHAGTAAFLIVPCCF